MAKKIRVGVLMGGISTEHDISIASGKSILKHLDADKYVAQAVIIARDGSFSTEQDSFADVGLALTYIKNNFDVIYIALHGKLGEDGVIQGFLETAQIKYTGPGVLASALAMDKVKCQDLLVASGFTMAEYIDFYKIPTKDYIKEVVKIFEEDFAYPAVLKPVDGGSSAATFLLKDNKDIEKKVKEAFKVTDHIMFQRYTKGEEFACGVLEEDEQLMALPPIQIISSNEFFDYKAKYDGSSQEICPPPNMEEEMIVYLQDLAIKAHAMLGCDGISRTDFIVTADNEVYTLEVNTVPGMTDESLYPKTALALGMEFPELLDKIITNALSKK